MDRAHALSGKTLGELASQHALSSLAASTMADVFRMPSNLQKNKGFVGQLIEWHLGATAHNLPEPDFLDLNIELKTLPLNAAQLPQESTYVCTAPLNAEQEYWENSRVRKKLARVLWVPVEAENTIPLSERRVGTALLWDLDPESEKILKQDWEELMSMIQMGEVEKISAKMGTYLQIRPKAAHSRILMPTLNDQGEMIMANPKGFYLRTIFTKKIIQKFFCKHY